MAFKRIGSIFVSNDIPQSENHHHFFSYLSIYVCLFKNFSFIFTLFNIFFRLFLQYFSFGLLYNLMRYLSMTISNTLTHEWMIGFYFRCIKRFSHVSFCYYFFGLCHHVIAERPIRSNPNPLELRTSSNTNSQFISNECIHDAKIEMTTKLFYIRSLLEHKV